MIKAAVLGFGVVGSGTAEILEKSREMLSRRAGCDVELKYILDIREFPGHPLEHKIVHDFAVIENDPEVNVVAEVIGGAKIAYEFTKRALLAGKHVVTSNKELVATKGPELLAIAKEKNVNYLFEASVGGGIPVIRPMNQCLTANEFEEITGILNGTTNYILTQMIEEGKSFEVALKDAQKNGYAEQNPAADIEGVDACRKIAILASLAYGQWVNPDLVYTQGITGVTLEDVAFAAQAGMVIKLLGRCVKLDNGKLNVMVAPHLLSCRHQLSHVDDVFNGVMIHGDNVGDVMFYGQGAGKLATASAVVADIVDIAHHLEKRRDIFWEDKGVQMVEDHDACHAKYYVRVEWRDGLEMDEAVKAVRGKQKLIFCDDYPRQRAMITDEDTEAALQAKVAKLAESTKVLSVIRVL